MITVNIHCGNCRKCKYVGFNMLYRCKHRSETFYPIFKMPCEHWLPSKSDLRLWIGHDKNKGAQKEG